MIPIVKNTVWTDQDVLNHRTYLETETGRRWLQNLVNNRMPPVSQSVAHQDSYRLGAIAGYEQSIFNTISLSVSVPPPKAQPQANYGVKDPVPEK